MVILNVRGSPHPFDLIGYQEDLHLRHLAIENNFNLLLSVEVQVLEASQRVPKHLIIVCLRSKLWNFSKTQKANKVILLLN